MTEIDHKFLSAAKSIVDRLTPGMVEREPETIAGWIALALQEEVRAERQRWVEGIGFIEQDFPHKIYDAEHKHTIADDGFALEEYDARCVRCRLAALRERLKL